MSAAALAMAATFAAKDFTLFLLEYLFGYCIGCWVIEKTLELRRHNVDQLLADDQPARRWNMKRHDNQRHRFLVKPLFEW
jgi:hypothetical protein